MNVTQQYAADREARKAALHAAGINFTTNNGGAMLCIECGMTTINFWPGSAAWVADVPPCSGNSVESLIEFCRKLEGDYA